MKFNGLLTSLLLLVLSGQAAGSQSAGEKRDPEVDAILQAQLEEDLELLLEWSQGVFSNTAFLYEQDAANVPDSHRYPHDSYRYTRIDNVPSFGGSVTLGQSFENADPRQPQYAVVVSYEISLEHNGILSDVNYLPDAADFVNAHKNPDMIRRLVKGKDTSTNNEECHALIRRVGDQFISEHVTGTCTYSIMNRPAVTNTFVSMVAENERWIWSLGQYENGEVRYGNTDRMFNKYYRLTPASDESL